MVDLASFRVGVITDRMDDARAQVIGGLESAVRPHGGTVLIVVHHRQNPVRGGLLRQLARSGRLDAVLVLPLASAGSGHSRLDEILSFVEDLPTVTVGARHPSLPMVDVAETVLASQVLDHLVADCGRNRPVLVGTSTDEAGWSRRNRAIEHAALARGVSIGGSEELLRCFDQHSAQAAFGRWLTDATGDEPHERRALDSVVCGSDEIAVGVLACLADQGYVVPDEVSVVSYGNTDASWGAHPRLTSADERLREQGAAAGRYLLGRLAGEDVPLLGRVASVDAGGLVVRGSSLIQENDDETEAPLAEPPGTEDDEAKQNAWRRQRRLELARGATVRSNEQLLSRLATASQTWHAGRSGPEPARSQQAVADEMADIVRSFPEPVWWRAWLQLLPSRLQASGLGQLAGDELRTVVLSTSLLVERVLADARESRERRAHVMSQQILELEQSLVGCSSLVELCAVLKAFLPRLGLIRCFLALYDEPVPFDQKFPVGGQARLVLVHGVPGVDIVGDTDSELWERAPSFESAQVLPPELAAELDHDTLMLQPVFGDDARYGFVAYEGSGQDRHVGETVRLAITRVLQAKARTRLLTSRSEELAEQVAARTSELEVEVASRRLAQDELAAANDRLRQALLRDGLTGLFNRPAFDEQLERAWGRTTREGRVFSVLMCDVDHFKSYNDVHGHLAGDDCLREVARILQQAADRPDDMVARYGGEEFVLVLGDTDLAGAEVVAQRVVQAVREAAIAHHGTHARVTVSVGAACSSGHLEAPDLLNSADRALYRAKAGGRDCYRIDLPLMTSAG